MHGTFNTLLGAGRLVLGIPKDQDLAGRLYVTSGLGGMSGAQGKAAEIAGAASLIAEVDYVPHHHPLHPGLGQPWSPTACPRPWLWPGKSWLAKEPCAIAYHGNVVDLLEYLYDQNVDHRSAVGSDLLPRWPTTAATAPRA